MAEQSIAVCAVDVELGWCVHRYRCCALVVCAAGARFCWRRNCEHGQAEAGSLARLIPMLFPSDYGELVVVLS